jgi:transposase
MMSKQYTAAFKAKVVQELLKEEKTLVQIASENEVHPTQLKNWRAIVLTGMAGLFEKQESTAALKAAYEQQQTELYAEIGKLSTQVTWLKKKFQRLSQRGAGSASRARGKRPASECASGVAGNQSVQFVLSATASFQRRDQDQTSN